MTLNIWDGGRALNDAIAFIKEENPDILGLQEVYDGTDPTLEARFRTMDILRKELAYPYDHFAAEFVEERAEGRIPQGNAVLSRFPIAQQRTTYFFGPMNEHFVETPENVLNIAHNLEHLVLTTPSGPIDFINFHGIKDNDGDNNSEKRQKMVATLIDEIEGKKNIIITGDTNARPTNASMQKLSRKINNVFGSTIPSTFNMKRKDNPGYATSVVDMIFVSDSFEVFEQRVPMVDISDHLPLVVRLHMK